LDQFHEQFGSVLATVSPSKLSKYVPVVVFAVMLTNAGFEADEDVGAAGQNTLQIYHAVVVKFVAA
jgi:hypothetical protein